MTKQATLTCDCVCTRWHQTQKIISYQDKSNPNISIKTKNLGVTKFNNSFCFYAKRLDLSSDGVRSKCTCTHLKRMTGLNRSCLSLPLFSPPLVSPQKDTSSSALRGEGWHAEISCCFSSWFLQWEWEERGVLVFLEALGDMAALTGQVGPGHLVQ